MASSAAFRYAASMLTVLIDTRNNEEALVRTLGSLVGAVVEGIVRVLHGRPNLSLLKARQPYLCQECHQDHGRQLFSSAQVANGPGSPALGVSVNATTGLAGKQLSIQGNGRMCGNCHSVIHGSNAPNGGFFNR